MVRAILDGRKTQTRRVIKPQPENVDGPNFDGLWSETNDPVTRYFTCKHGQIGDRLWVRETWATPKTYDAYRPRDCSKTTPIYYSADKSHGKLVRWTDEEQELGKLRPSIFMPRWVSRITLENESMRCERLQDISEVDAIAEGIEAIGQGWINYQSRGLGDTNKVVLPRDSFRSLWDSINVKRGFGWDKNPFVWVLTFHCIPQP